MHNSKDIERTLSCANDFRNRGNRAISKSDFEAAIVEYEKILSLFEWIETIDGTSSWKSKVMTMIRRISIIKYSKYTIL